MDKSNKKLLKTRYNLKTKNNKYTFGTQKLNTNTDPTTLYSNNRKQSTVEMDFNNSQQAVANQNISKINSQNSATQANNNFNNQQTSADSSRGLVQGVVSKIPGAGTLVGAGIGIAGGINDNLRSSAYNKDLANGKVSYSGSKGLANVIDPTTNLIKGVGLDGGGFNASNLVSGLTAGVVNLNGSKDDLATEKAIYAKKQNDNLNNQLNKYGAIDSTSQVAQAKKGSAGIHIKPSHKGRFTEYKKRTGKTTEEALHSKDPHIRQMANFANNASKWKHKDGTKDLTLNKLIDSHSKSYNEIEKKESPKVEKDELKEFKKLKTLENNKYKKLKKGVRQIETEGREPIFSPKKTNGDRDLLYYNPNDPTHKQGGVKAIVTPKTGTERIKGLLNIPEGSAIVTAENNMNKKAIEAYKKGDKKLLNKIIDKMPNDTKSKKASGDSSLEQEEQVPPAKSASNNSFLPGVMNGINKGISNYNNIPQKQNKFSSLSNGLGNSGNTLLAAAPTIYNLSRGISNPQQTQRNFINNEQYKYIDTSNPLRAAANEEYRVNDNNIRNATGGQGGSYLANASLAAAQRFKDISNIETNQQGRKVDINNANTDIRNQQNVGNLELTNQYNQQDLQNRAVRNNFLAAGFTGMSDLAQNHQLMKNEANADNIRASTLETQNFKRDPNTGKINYKNKGTKLLKSSISSKYKKK